MTAKFIKMPSIAYVVARSFPEGIIGCENALPWHLSSDMRRFKKITSDHVVIMGRKTLESIGKPLPNRINIVLSRSGGEDCENLIWVRDRESALFLADYHSILRGRSEFFVIGGSEVFAIFNDLFNRVHLTEVFCGGLVSGDSFFNHQFDTKNDWRFVDEVDCPKSEHDDFPSRYIILDKRVKKNRYLWSTYFLTDKSYIRDFYETNRDTITSATETKIVTEQDAQQDFPELKVS